MLSLEYSAGIHAIYHFHSDTQPFSLKKWLFDPSYEIESTKVKNLFLELKRQGHVIGLHPGFNSWNDSKLIEAQRISLEHSAGVQVKYCRQHWLRFSWRSTWFSQQSADISCDTTLMFNDRPSFRNSSALSWHPWDMDGSRTLNLLALPSVFMDSHFYDYQPISNDLRKTSMRRWVNECFLVGGEIAILWHPHTLSKDYGWSDGFIDLLSILKEFQPPCQ